MRGCSVLPFFLKKLDPMLQNYQLRFQQTVIIESYRALSLRCEDVKMSELFDLMSMLQKLMMA